MLKLNGFLKVCEYALIRVMRVWRVVKLNPFVGIIPKNIPPKLFLYILPILPADNNRELKHARFWYAEAHSGCRPRLKNARACLSSLMLPRALRGGFRGGGKMRIGPLGLFTGKTFASQNWLFLVSPGISKTVAWDGFRCLWGGLPPLALHNTH